MSAKDRSQGKLTVARAKAIHDLRKERPTNGVRVVWTAKRGAEFN